MATTDPTTGNPSLLKTLLPIGVILAIVVAGLIVVKSSLRPRTDTAATSGDTTSPANPGSSEMTLGSTLPDFAVTAFTAKNADTIGKAGGKVTLINFWATWCEACMVEMPSLVKLEAAYRAKGFKVVAIDLDDKPEAVLPKTLKELGITFPVYLDTDSKLSELFDVHAIPLTVIIDRNRKVLFMENGERNWNSEEIHSKLEQWLSG